MHIECLSQTVSWILWDLQLLLWHTTACLGFFLHASSSFLKISGDFDFSSWHFRNFYCKTKWKENLLGRRASRLKVAEKKGNGAKLRWWDRDSEKVGVESSNREHIAVQFYSDCRKFPRCPKIWLLLLVEFFGLLTSTAFLRLGSSLGFHLPWCIWKQSSFICIFSLGVYFSCLSWLAVVEDFFFFLVIE